MYNIQTAVQFFIVICTLFYMIYYRYKIYSNIRETCLIRL